jgi:hypothetical protein
MPSLRVIAFGVGVANMTKATSITNLLNFPETKSII